MVRVTVKDLAAAVGVSPSTVSNAYNRPDQLSAELRSRILAAADRLGFAGPDAAARTLRVGRSGAVGVLLNERLSFAFSDPFAVEFLTGLSEVVETEAVSIMLVPVAGQDGSDLRAVQQASIDALAILAMPLDHPAARLAAARGIRIVGTDPDPAPGSSWVAIDDRAAGALVGAHLATLGHHRVAVVAETNSPAGGPAGELAVSAVTQADYRARIAGLRETLAGDLLLVSAGHNAVASGRRATQWLLEREPWPTAVVGLSDVLALGVLTALHEAGLTVPADVSVCGFDDIAAAAAAELTTVAQPIRERGRHVGRLLLEPAADLRQVLLPIVLRERGSSGPARR